MPFFTRLRVYSLLSMLLCATMACDPEYDAIPIPAHARVYGSVPPESADTIRISHYASALGILSNTRQTLASGIPDSTGSFSLSFPWPKLGRVSVACGEMHLLYDTYLLPGDTIGVFQDSLFLEISAKDYVDFQFQFNDVFILDESSAALYAERNDLAPEEFSAYIDNRQHQQRLMIEGGLDGEVIDSSLYIMLWKDILYAWATDRLQYVGYRSAFQPGFSYAHLPDGYFDFLDSMIVLANREVLHTEHYQMFLARLIEYRYDMADSEVTLTRSFENAALERFAIAEKLMQGEIWQIAVTKILVDEIDILLNFSDRVEAAPSKAKYAYNRRLNTLDSLIAAFGKHTDSSAYYSFLFDSYASSFPEDP